MKKSYTVNLKSIFITLGLVFSSIGLSQAQLTTITTVPPLTGGNGSEGTTFNISSTQDIIVDSILQALQTISGQNVEVWYTTTAINGAPTIASPAWIQIGTASNVTGISAGLNPTLQTLPIGIGLLIPAGATYGFYVGASTSTSVIYTTHVSGGAFTDGILTINTGPNVGYGGAKPNPTFSTRQWNGAIKYHMASQLSGLQNDAGISDILSISPLCNGSHPLQVEVSNFGTNLISGVSIGWSVNGTIQTPFSLTTPLDTVNGAFPSSQIVTIGNVMLDGSTNVKAWTNLPNNVVDPENTNDSTDLIFDAMKVTANLANGINCNGGSNGVAQATVVNNNGGGMTYSWSNGANGANLIGVQAGTYILTGTNGTCTDTASIVITQPTAISQTNVTTGVQCNGDSTGMCTLTISGGTPGYNVTWAAGGSGATNNALPGGPNNFSISDANGCSITGTITIPQPTALALTAAITPESFGNDGAIDLSVSGGTPTYTYVWTNSATTQDLSSLIAGTYSVTVSDANGCTATLSNVVNSVVGLNEVDNQFGFTIYPNPSNGQFTVNLSNFDNNNSVEIFDVLGKRIVAYKNVDSSTKINLNEKNGVYLVKITNGTSSFVERIVLKR